MKKNEMVVYYLTILSEMYNKKISESVSIVYWKVLNGYSQEDLENAFNEVIKTSKYFPKPVEIIEAITGGKDDRSLTAWSKVIEAAKKYGYYSSIDFGDPLIARAISLIGGWKSICNTNLDDIVWVQKEFERVYKNLIISRYSGKDTVVVGYIEMKNRSEGFIDEIPEPIKIDQTAIKSIEENKP